MADRCSLDETTELLDAMHRVVIRRRQEGVGRGRKGRAKAKTEPKGRGRNHPVDMSGMPEELAERIIEAGLRAAGEVLEPDAPE